MSTDCTYKQQVLRGRAGWSDEQVRMFKNQRMVRWLAERRKAKRQEAAAVLCELRNKRGDEAQLQLLVDNGHGHCREAQRLRKKLQAFS